MKCQYRRCADLATRKILVQGVQVGVCCYPHAQEMAQGFSAELVLLPRRRERKKPRPSGSGGKI